jgi:Bifunctional DNA primase/polymerase, N-terminal
MSPRQAAAVQYARAGWPVFPVAADKPDCQRGEDCRCKAPLTPHGLKDAETDPRTVTRFWARHPDANVAIATGAPGPTVLDVDVAHGKPGNRSLNEAIRAGLVPSPMAAIRTPSGGSHLYYQGDAQGNGSMPKKGLDLRGKGGYVVAPPSLVHGRPYEVVSHSAQPASIDFAAIRQHLEPQPERRAWQPEPGRHGVGHLADYVARLEEGNRNAGTFWAACRAVEAGDSETLAAIARAATSTGLDQRAVDKTIASAQRTARPKAPDREAG